MQNVFATRLGRVADRVDLLTRDPAGRQQQLQRLRLRSRILDLAVLLAAFAGGLTCCAALTLFFGALQNAGSGRLLFALFGGALSCAVLALISFSVETILSGRTVREQTEPGAPADPAPSDG
ncbi:DUF2721 domain-containing protein (plasmid) [Polymorphobacter sp. PAMC 29334]|nr:DUF2721 domain-containing protein [Polymorphobacter sp. PAMC 29334]